MEFIDIVVDLDVIVWCITRGYGWPRYRWARLCCIIDYEINFIFLIQVSNTRVGLNQGRFIQINWLEFKLIWGRVLISDDSYFNNSSKTNGAIPVDETWSPNVDDPVRFLWIRIYLSPRLAHDTQCKAVAKTINRTMQESIFVAMPATWSVFNCHSSRIRRYRLNRGRLWTFIHSSHCSLSTLNRVAYFFIRHPFSSNCLRARKNSQLNRKVEFFDVVIYFDFSSAHWQLRQLA